MKYLVVDFFSHLLMIDENFFMHRNQNMTSYLKTPSLEIF